MKEEKGVERVLFIATELEARGTNEYVSYLAEELRRRDIASAVFCAPGPMLKVLKQKNIPAFTFEHLGAFRIPSGQKNSFRDELDNFSPDIVHAPSLQALKPFLSIAGDRTIPMVITMHSAPKRRRALRKIAPELSGIIVTSQKVREELVNSYKIPKNKTVMICSGIDIEKITQENPGPVFSREVPTIGCVGPVERARGHALFIKAAPLLLQAGKKVQFVIAGEGSELTKLSKLGSEYGLDKCLTFVRDFASYHEILDALDIVVQSAQEDVSGFSILDAMGYGKPVVAFNTGTACEIIRNGETGLIVPREDPDALAQALEKLVERPQWARTLGENARNSVSEKFNIHKNADSIIDFYNQIL